MNCSYHPTNDARARCRSCTRSLCAACDHRIKGLSYCQDCIVMGIDNLSRHYSRTRSDSRRKARVAALCALLPGMGAVYNRQYVKTVVHFITIMGLFKLAAIHLVGGFFLVAGLVFYMYSMVDAYRTARLIAEGESAAADEARFKRSLARRMPLIGSIMIVAGVVYVLQILNPFGISVARLLPVGLIILGGYLLVRYFKRADSRNYEPHNSRLLPFALIRGRNTEDQRRESRGASWRGGPR